jgi:RNA polymerase sigma-70 factor (ECF subfamily)
MTWTEITSLVLRAQNGDREAYGELAQRFQPTVYAVALGKLRNPSEAEELAQEVFLHAMRKLDQLHDPQCFAGWLRQITVRMAINRLTRRGPFQGPEPEILENTEAATVGPLDELVRSEDRSEVLAGLKALKALDRATLVAFYLRGRSLKQMSREFETPVGTIKRRLHVARARLKRVLEGCSVGASGGEKPARRKVRRKRELACV